MKLGMQLEPSTAETYSRTFGRNTYEVGFVINPTAFHLGCTPDRRVYDPEAEEGYGLLEIKCPAATYVAECKYLLTSQSKERQLSKSHQYYYQVMGQMGLTGAAWCDFFVYTTNDYHCERIAFDSEFFNNMLEKLDHFYFNFLYLLLFKYQWMHLFPMYQLDGKVLNRGLAYYIKIDLVYNVQKVSRLNLGPIWSQMVQININLHIIYFCSNKGPWKFVSRQHTAHNWFIVPARFKGIGASKIWNSLNLLIALSTWTLKLAIFSFSSVSSLVNWTFRARKFGITSIHSFFSSRSWITNPLSAITWSPLSSRSKMPDTIVMCLSDMLPAYRLLTNVSSPEGAIPTKLLNVVVPL